jgi:hypothetical protein
MVPTLSLLKYFWIIVINLDSLIFINGDLAKTLVEATYRNKVVLGLVVSREEVGSGKIIKNHKFFFYIHVNCLLSPQSRLPKVLVNLTTWSSNYFKINGEK